MKKKSLKKAKKNFKKARTYCENFVGVACYAKLKEENKTLVFGSVAQLIRPAMPTFGGLGLPWPFFGSCFRSALSLFGPWHVPAHFWSIALPCPIWVCGVVFWACHDRMKKNTCRLSLL